MQRVQRRQQPLALGARGVSAVGRVPVGAALGADPTRHRRAEERVDRIALGRTRLGVEEVDVHVSACSRRAGAALLVGLPARQSGSLA